MASVDTAAPCWIVHGWRLNHSRYARRAIRSIRWMAGRSRQLSAHAGGQVRRFGTAHFMGGYPAIRGNAGPGFVSVEAS
jgi:hypothetical protein